MVTKYKSSVESGAKYLNAYANNTSLTFFSFSDFALSLSRATSNAAYATGVQRGAVGGKEYSSGDTNPNVLSFISRSGGS